MFFFLPLTQDLTICIRRLQHFNNEPYEVAQYDKTLQEYERASVKISTSLATLNSGQNVIFSTALTVMMGLAAQGVLKGERYGAICALNPNLTAIGVRLNQAP